MSAHRGIDPDRLTGEAAEQYARTVRMHEAFGAPRERASRHAIDDLIEAGVVELSPFDARVDRFRKLGMSESGAKRAAIGREYRSEAEARRAMGEGADDEGPLTAAEHKRINESAQFKRYMELRESGVGPWEAAEQATREILKERYKLATNSSRTPLSESAPVKLTESPCCGVTPARNASGRCPKCRQPVAG